MDDFIVQLTAKVDIIINIGCNFLVIFMLKYHLSVSNI